MSEPNTLTRIFQAAPALTHVSLLYDAFDPVFSLNIASPDNGTNPLCTPRQALVRLQRPHASATTRSVQLVSYDVECSRAQLAADLAATLTRGELLRNVRSFNLTGVEMTSELLEALGVWLSSSGAVREVSLEVVLGAGCTWEEVRTHVLQKAAESASLEVLEWTYLKQENGVSGLVSALGQVLSSTGGGALKHVKLNGAHASMEAMLELAQGLAACASVTCLTMRGPDKGTVAAVAEMVRSAGLEELYLIDGDLGDAAVGELAVAVETSPTLRVLGLSGCGFNVDVVGYLVMQIQASPAMEGLVLSNNHLGDTGVELLTEAKGRLTRLELRNTGITADGAMMLSGMVATGKLEHLVMSYNRYVRDDGVSAVARAAARRGTMRVLDVEETAHTRNGAAEVANIVTVSPALRELAVSVSKGDTELVERIAESTSLKKVQLVLLEAAAVDRVAALVRTNRSIETLSVTWDATSLPEVGKALAGAVVEALPGNPMIKTLDLCARNTFPPNPCSIEQLQTVAECLARNNEGNFERQLLFLLGMFGSHDGSPTLKRWAASSMFDIHVLGCVFELMDGRARGVVRV